jgi:hypothetical protein
LAAILRTPSVRPGAFRAARIRFSSSAGIDRPAQPFPFATGPRQPSADSFLDHRPLELGEDAHHLKHRLAGRRGRVDSPLVQEQVDLERMQLRQERHKLLQAAAEAMHRPSQTTANQDRELREIAGRCGWEITKVYRDHGISGAKGRDKRPAFDALCRDATKRQLVPGWAKAEKLWFFSRRRCSISDGVYSYKGAAPWQKILWPYEMRHKGLPRPGANFNTVGRSP